MQPLSGRVKGSYGDGRQVRQGARIQAQLKACVSLLEVQVKPTDDNGTQAAYILLTNSHAFIPEFRTHLFAISFRIASSVG